MNKRLLLLSNSTNFGENYLSWPKNYIKSFLGNEVNRVLFIPYAGVTTSYDEYSSKVGNVFISLGVKLESIHTFNEPIKSIMEAEAIVIGGGNTFHLNTMLHKSGIIQAIKEKVNNGTPYIGWSAGSNVASPSIKTTNDMPIIEPPSFDALNLIPFQINPHYTDVVPPNFNGETRQQRLMEYLEVNQNIYVVGLHEGTLLKLEQNTIKLVGDKPIKVFKFGNEIKDYDSSANLDFLLK